jgi:hypothetical protein
MIDPVIQLMYINHLNTVRGNTNTYEMTRAIILVCKVVGQDFSITTRYWDLLDMYGTEKRHLRMDDVWK